MYSTSASQPLIDGKVPHLLCKREDIGEIVLLPGDPARVALFKEICDDFQIISQNREFTVGTGYYHGLKISVCSTGIGAPSTEIAVIQLISLGVKALIRIGGTGVIREDVACGSFVINTGAMRLGGASTFYAPIEYPAIASFEVVDSMRQACKIRKNPYTMGLCVSTGSFYHGQGRSVPFESDFNEKEIVNHYQKLNILNLEMEAETIFTLASIYGVLSGSICTVHCNRITDVWMTENLDSQIEMCETALLGASYLYDTYLSVSSI